MVTRSNLVHNTQLIDSCLEKAYPSAREPHLWKCVKDDITSTTTHKSNM